MGLQRVGHDLATKQQDSNRVNCTWEVEKGSLWRRMHFGAHHQREDLGRLGGSCGCMWWGRGQLETAGLGRRRK